jgi:sRNA-binding regulator protein Hfq
MSDKLKIKTQDDKTKPAHVWGVSSREFFDAMQNKPVRVTSIDGKVYAATLIGLDLYDLILKQSDGALILMPKHAIKLIVPGNGKTE